MCCAVCSTVPTDLFVCLIISSARSLRYKKRGEPPPHRRRRPLLWHTIGVITARRTLCTRRGQNVNGSLVFDQLCKRVIKPSAKRRGEARGRHRGQVEGRRCLPRLRVCRPPGPQPPKIGRKSRHEVSALSICKSRCVLYSDLCNVYKTGNTMPLSNRSDFK